MNGTLDKKLIISLIIVAVLSVAITLFVTIKPEEKKIRRPMPMASCSVAPVATNEPVAGMASQSAFPEYSASDELQKYLTEIQRLRLQNQELRARVSELEVAGEASMANCVFELMERENNGSNGALLSDEQIDEAYSEPFNSFIKSKSEWARSSAYDFHQESRESESSADLEIRIADYYALHELASEVQLQQVSCKSARCELLVNLTEANSLASESIFYGVLEQSWFKSKGFSNTEVTNDDGQIIAIIYYVEIIKDQVE